MSKMNLKSSYNPQMNIHEVNFIDNSGNIIMKLNNIRNTSMTIENGNWCSKFINCTIDADNFDYFIKNESKVKEIYINMMECKYREI